MSHLCWKHVWQSNVTQQSLFITKGRGVGGFWLCHDKIIPDPSPLKLCNISMTPPPPSLIVNWPSSFYSPPSSKSPLATTDLPSVPLKNHVILSKFLWSPCPPPQAMYNDWFPKTKDGEDWHGLQSDPIHNFRLHLSRCTGSDSA